MLKIRLEMLKSRKNSKTIKLEKNSQKNFPNPGNSEDFQDPGIPGNFFKNFLFPGKLKIREKGKPYLGAKNTDCRLASGKIWPLISVDFGTPTEKGCPSLILANLNARKG